MPQKEVSILSSINLHNELFHLIANARTNKFMHTYEEDRCFNQQCLELLLLFTTHIYDSFQLIDQYAYRCVYIHVYFYAKISNQSCSSAFKWWPVKLKLIPSMAYKKKKTVKQVNIKM